MEFKSWDKNLNFKQKVFQVNSTSFKINPPNPLLKLSNPPIISTRELSPMNIIGTKKLSPVKSITDPNTKVVYAKNPDKEYFKSNNLD